jgi:LysM repeat protein
MNRCYSRPLSCARPFVFALLLLTTLSACGQVVTRPTPMPPTMTPTVTPTALPTAQATPTPAPYTPEPTATPTLEPTPVVHTIAAGETLISIARKYGVSVQAIQEVNGITDPRTLRVSQKIRIPTDPDAQLGVGTPTPEPTPLSVEISPVYFGSESSGTLWGLGEVKNPGSQPLEGVRIGLQLLDDNGQVLAEGETPIAINLLEPGASSPFGIRFGQAPADFANYFATALDAYPAHLGGYYRDLQVLDVRGEGERYYTFHLTGVVRNTGPEDAVEVMVTATLYDVLGQIIGFRRVEPEHNVIPLGGETTFTLSIIPLGGPVDSWQVSAEARRLVTPTPAP